MRNPVRVAVKVESKTKEEQKTPRGLTNHYQISPVEEKLARLIEFLQAHPSSKIILYFLTCASVEFYGKVLADIPALKGWRGKGDKGVPVLPMHGKMPTKKRNGHLEAFTSATQAVLLCTDVAARGLDIPDVDWIIQFDPPQDPNQFVHRIGRTARMGKRGSSLVFLLPKEDAYADFLRGKQIPIKELPAQGEVPKEGIATQLKALFCFFLYERLCCWEALFGLVCRR